MKFIKKAVTIEAMQCSGHDESLDAMKWCDGGIPPFPRSGNSPLFFIHTLEGDMEVMPNDWVIKGVKGEFYPCKPDIFEMTYERIEEASPRLGFATTHQLIGELFSRVTVAGLADESWPRYKTVSHE